MSLLPARRRQLGWLAGTAVLAVLPAARSQPQPRVIQLVARRFAYEPGEIHLKVGEDVLIEIRSLDFFHGMNIPDLKRRLDLQPGLVTPLRLRPERPGVIEFLCDNFCGDGHEEMHGRFVVSA